MARASERFQVSLAADPAHRACRQAIATLGWQLDAVQPDRLLVWRSFGFLNAESTRVEIGLSYQGQDETAISLDGRMPLGIGRGDRRALLGWMNAIRNAIEVAAEQQRK
ncbi:MAG: hypothetical protein ACKVWR_13490 [Acidimicrobiales bacterium]